MLRLVVAALMVCAGCAAPSQEPHPPPTPHVEPPPTPDPSCPEDVSEAVLLRLSPDQFERSVRAALGDDGALPAIPSGPRGAAITELEVAAYNDVARTLVSRGGHLAYVPCNPDGSFDGECFRGFVRAFGLRTFRRPISDDELATLEEVWSGLTTHPEIPAVTFREGIDVVAEVMLQSPQSIYRHVQGVDDPNAPEGLRRTTAYERAEILAFLLTDAAPDAHLLAAAQRGELDSPEGLRAWAAALLETPRARAMARKVASAWLGLEKTDRRPSLEDALKDPLLFPLDSPALRGAMRDEVESLYERVLFEGDARFASLLLSRDAKVNGPLAELYGLRGEHVPRTADDFAWVQLPESERAGLFTRAAFLSQTSGRDHTSPIRRGVHLYREVLGLALGDPPPNVNDVPPTPGGEGHLLTTRGTVERMTSPAACSGCHSLINPLGFALEGFDALGARRTVEHVATSEGTVALPIDSTAAVRAGDIDATVSGAVELSELLARSELARDAHVDLWFERAAGQPPASRDACTIDSLRGPFRAEGDLRALIVELAAGPRTRWVRPQQEVAP